MAELTLTRKDTRSKGSARTDKDCTAYSDGCTVAGTEVTKCTPVDLANKTEEVEILDAARHRVSKCTEVKRANDRNTL